MSLTPKEKKNSRPSAQGPAYMLIKIGYSCKLLYPIEEGAAFIEQLSKAREYKKEYNEPAEVMGTPPGFEVEFMTAAEMTEIRFRKTLGMNDDD